MIHPKYWIYTLLITAALIYFYQPLQPQMIQQSANFSENDKINLRHLVQKANILYYPNYTAIGVYLKGEMTYTYNTLWNVVVYLNEDYVNEKFYITGKYDEEHKTKKYFQVTDSEPYGLSILLLEANNTPGWRSKNQEHALTKFKQIKRGQTPLEKKQAELQFTKSKSENVYYEQEDVIDAAVAAAFTSFGPDLVNFTKAVYRGIQAGFAGRQSEVWDICTSYQDMPNFSLRFTSPDFNRKWIDYSFYGKQESWHITVWNHFTYQKY